MIRVLPLVAVLLVAGPAAADDPPADPGTLAVDARAVLKTHCAGCHVGAGSENGYAFDALDVASMVKRHAADDPPVLVPKDPAASRIWVRAGIDKNMPPRSKPRLTAAELDVLKKWIAAGAPAPVGDKPRPFRSPFAVLKTMNDHLAAADSGARPFLRYFTLTNLHNNPTVTADELRLTRAALSKAVNSLSRQPRLAIPRAVDEHETVYAIDLRDVGWDRHGLWRLVLSHYPYGLDYAGCEDDALRTLAKEHDKLCRGELVAVRADWFVATATRPPLYHDLLRLPDTAQQLRKELQVDREANIRTDAVWRAGFQASGVSGQNRLVERHDSPVAVYYWESYDFLPRKARANLLRFPLGPPHPDNEYPKQAFDHDGGEMIFGLANGLQAYYLADGRGKRIDQGPTDVVSDGLRTSGTPAIVNGMSCMHCHKLGTIACTDTVRANHALSGDARDKVLRLYPPADKFAAMLKADEDRFVAALEKTVGPFLKVGRDRDKSVRDFEEPVGEVARAYRVRQGAEVDLVKAAAELGVEKPETLAEMIRGNPALKELGVLTLAAGKSVKRDDWDGIDGTSLFQDVALALRLGTPRRVR